MNADELVSRLVRAAGPQRVEAGFVIKARYQPGGGAGEKVMPPTFPPQRRGEQSRYLTEDRLIDGERVSTVVLDQVPSQANRVEEALLKARDAGALALPMFELTADGVRLTSLQMPHRYADAYLRDSEVKGVRFDDSVVGKSLRSATTEDVRPLYRREPYSLLFGAWDSHRKGRWPKFARLYQSAIFGIGPVEGARFSGRFDPLNLAGAIDDKNKAEAGWRFIPSGEKARGQRLSEIGHGHIAPGEAHGGVTVREIHRRAWISFAGLERLQFGDASAQAATLARATLAAMALVGDRLTFATPSVVLRSGCDLTLVSETLAFEVSGGTHDPVDLSTADAVSAFLLLRKQTADAGILMDDDVVGLTPTKQLREAIAATRTAPAEEQE